MPVIEVNCTQYPVASSCHEQIATEVSNILNVPEELVWYYVNEVRHLPFKRITNGSVAPIVFINCKDTHCSQLIKKAVSKIKNILAEAFKCKKAEVFVAIRRIKSDEVYYNSSES